MFIRRKLHYTCRTEKTFVQNSEANASVLLENIEEIFPRYYMHSLNTQQHNYVLPVTKGLDVNFDSFTTEKETYHNTMSIL